MNYLMQKMLGLLLMNEVPADGGQGDGGGGESAAASTPAPDAGESTPAAGNDPAGSVLGDLLKHQEGDGKPEDDGAKDGEGDQGKGSVPEAYDLKAPEGVELEDSVMPQVQELFKELGLPQDKAQEVFDKLLAIDQARNPTPEQVQQQYEQQAMDLNKQWGAECAKLPDLGGENFNRSLETCSKVLTRFSTPELRDFLTYSALGSNPEFFKFVHAIGESMSADTLEHGGSQATKRSPEQIMYGN